MDQSGRHHGRARRRAVRPLGALVPRGEVALVEDGAGGRAAERQEARERAVHGDVKRAGGVACRVAWRRGG